MSSGHTATSIREKVGDTKTDDVMSMRPDSSNVMVYQRYSIPLLCHADSQDYSQIISDSTIDYFYTQAFQGLYF